MGDDQKISKQVPSAVADAHSFALDVNSLREHYQQSGGYRPEDVYKVLGDQRQSLFLDQTSEKATSAFLRRFG